MADNHDHLHENGLQEFSEETVRRFLLGRLSASERRLFEQRFITDDGLDARVRLAEFDLADDYAFERLSAPDRRLFEQRFLLTSNRQHQLMVSEALRARFSSTTMKSSEGHTVTQRLRDLFGLSRLA